jgi:hypothetical protein
LGEALRGLAREREWQWLRDIVVATDLEFSPVWTAEAGR